MVLAAVRLVGNDDDVPALQKQGVFGALFVRKELVDGSEDYAAAGDLEKRLQVLAALGLGGLLAQKLVTTGEGAKELVVQVIPVGEHNQRRVLHRRLQHQPPGVERHRQRLPRALRMPYHTNPSVSRGAPRLGLREIAAASFLQNQLAHTARPHRFRHRCVYCVELVVTRHLLYHRRAVILEHDEMPHQVQEAALLEYPAQEHLQLRNRGRRHRLTLNRAPRHDVCPRAFLRAQVPLLRFLF